MLNTLSFYNLRFHISLKSETRLPAFPENEIRGGMGKALRLTVCSDPKRVCGDCILEKPCPYARFFSPRNLDGQKPFKKNQPIPRPFALNPFNRADSSIGLILIGNKKDELLPYVVFSIEEAGRNGIFKGRVKYKLTKVDSVAIDGVSECLYCDGRFCGSPFPIWMKDIQNNSRNKDHGVGQLTLHFRSPLRIKSNNGRNSHLIHRPSFQQVLKECIWRADLLNIYHCGGQTDYDPKAIEDSASTVETMEQNPVYWHTMNRYSWSQRKRQHMDGVMGEMTYLSKDLPRFMPFLRLGEYIHIGKNTTFGLGAIRVETG